MIPVGTVVSAMLAVAQRSVDAWEEPLAFRAGRLLDGRPISYAFTPFGGGVRHQPTRRRCSATALRAATPQTRISHGRGWFRTTDLSRVKRALSH